jgi:hypothetical protein
MSERCIRIWRQSFMGTILAYRVNFGIVVSDFMRAKVDVCDKLLPVRVHSVV